MADVSIFDSVSDIETDDNAVLEDVLAEIKDGRWQDMVLTIRKEKDKKKRQKLKERLPTITFSGLFTQRKDTCLVAHSGVINIDLDELEDVETVKSLLIKDRFVYSCFISTSGNGLRVLFRINGAKHKDAFYGLSDYLWKNYGLPVDPGSVSVSKPFLVTFDPFLFINDKAPIFTLYVKEKKIQKIEYFAFAEDDFSNLIKQIKDRNINLAEDHYDWVKIGFALSDKFGEGGRDYFHIVSSVDSRYNVRKTDKQFDYILKSKNSKLATISTFYWYCKQAGLQITSERTTKIRKATLNGKASGLTKSQIAKNLEKTTGITEAEDLIEQVFNGVADIGDEESVIDQLEMFISSNYNLRRNDLTKYLERDGKELQQSDFNSIYISAKRVIHNINYDLVDRLLLSDFVQRYNPIREFFDRLPQVTGTELIDKLSKTIKNSIPEYTNYFLKKWLVSIAGSAYGIHSPLMLILVGINQGKGKTEWFRRLLPDGLKRYYAESKLDAGKDDEILMTQKLVIMDDEMGSKTMKEASRLKELTSKQVFSLREPYGRNNVDLTRLAVLCGTSNTKALLNDPTGNRRLIPISCEEVDQNLFNSIDKNLLFAEIYNLFKSGFDYRVVTSEDIAYLRTNEHEYKVEDLEFELVAKFFKPSLNHSWLTTSEIKVEIDKLTTQKLSLNKIGRQLVSMQFIRRSININKASLMRWGVERINRGDDNKFAPLEVTDF